MQQGMTPQKTISERYLRSQRLKVPVNSPSQASICDHQSRTKTYKEHCNDLYLFVGLPMSEPPRDLIYTADPRAGYLAYKAEIDAAIQGVLSTPHYILGPA